MRLFNLLLFLGLYTPADSLPFSGTGLGAAADPSDLESGSDTSGGSDLGSDSNTGIGYAVRLDYSNLFFEAFFDFHFSHNYLLVSHHFRSDHYF